jgi:C1A family cysteine protease
MAAYLHCYNVSQLLTSGLIFFSIIVHINADPLMDDFNNWINENQKRYRDEIEKLKRFDIFKANYQFVISSNNNPDTTFRLGLNNFADLTNHEFLASLAGFIPLPGKQPSTPFRYENVIPPPSVDWRTSGAVTPVKDQGKCGE